MLFCYLLPYCKPTVKAKINHFFTKADCGYRLAMERPERKYGRPYLIADFCEQQLKATKLVKANDPESLNRLNQNQIKSSLYSPYYAEACNELRGPSPRLSAWATQLRRNVATVASRWRHCADLTGPGIEPQTSRTDSVRLAI